MYRPDKIKFDVSVHVVEGDQICDYHNVQVLEEKDRLIIFWGECKVVHMLHSVRHFRIEDHHEL